MGTYNLLKDYGVPDGHITDSVSVSSNWILFVVRYADPVTSSKARLANRTPYNTGNITYDDDESKLNRTRSSIVIDSDCVSLDINSTKGRFTNTLQAVLKPSKNYLSAIMPGDWVFAWIMQDSATFDSVKKKIKKGDSANDFDDGLKFIGKVQDIRKVTTQAENGMRTVQFNLQCTGFSELDSSVFFDPALSRNEQYVEKYMANMGMAMEKVFTSSTQNGLGGGIDANKILLVLINALLGTGLRGIATQSGGLDLATGAGVSTEAAPFAYVVPDGANRVLGVNRGGSVSTYADLLEVIQGLQKYKQSNFPDFFFPDGTGTDTNRHITTFPLLGTFLPVPTAFDNKTVWNLLNEYLNPAANEIYTAIKLTPTGKIMPALVIRQLPFSSPILTSKLGDKVTSFFELPRWKAHPVLVRALDIGRSDGERINFVHIYAQPTTKAMGSEVAIQIVRNPPICDPADIKRHGLRVHAGTVTSSAVNTVGNAPSEWMRLRADFLMGQHMMLTGMCSMVGVPSPICPGDNFEFEDSVYHIESVHHHAEISANGVKNFTTQLQLTHGMRSDLPAAISRIPATKKVRKQAHIRGDYLEQSEYASQTIRRQTSTAPENEEERQADTVADGTLFVEATVQNLTGVELEETIGGQNPDLYLYSGVDEEDNTSTNPGVSED